MEATRSDYLHLHFIIVVWSFTAILGLVISLPPVELVFYRTLLAGLGILAILIASGRTFRLFNSADVVRVCFAGVLLAAHWILFFLAARVANASVCLAGMATTSLFTSFVEPLYIKRKIKTFEVMLSLLALAGMLIIFKVEFEYILGFSIALVSALCAAFFMVINAEVTKNNDHFTITFYEMIVSTLAIAAFFPVYAMLHDEPLSLVPNAMDWVYLALLSGFCTVYAFSFSLKLMKKISAFTVNLSVNLEPVYGIMLALLFFGEKERMSNEFYLGTLLVLGAVLLFPYFNKKYNRKPIETDILR